MVEKKTFDDDFSEADEQKSENNFWAYKENKSIIGFVVDTQQSQYGDVVVLETADGNVAIPNLTALKSKLTWEDMGKKVKIVYNGELKSKTGKLYADFSVSKK